MTTSLVARARVLTVPADGFLSVELLDSRTCAGCRCGRLTAPEKRTVRLDLGPASGLYRGDELTIAMPAGDLLRAALWLHGLPWLGFVVGAAAGGLAMGGDLPSMLGAGLGLAAAFVALRWTRRHRDGLATSALQLTRTSCQS
jgi:positive regulator of sigma E activity